MKLRQQIISDRIATAAARLSKPDDYSFMLLAHALVTGGSLSDCDIGDIVDGGQDKQIDIITIDQDGEDVAMHILQVKNTDSFSSNSLIQMKNGLDWIFNKSRKDIQTLANKRFQDKIIEYRSVQNSVGPSNISVFVYFIANGTEENISDEFNKEADLIRGEYDNGTFKAFTLNILGAESLVKILNETEQKTRKIDANIKFKYDTNNPSLVRYYAGDLKGLVCSVSGFEIARLVSEDTEGAIFDTNIRRFLGTKGAVNKEIISSCSNPNDAHQFWFMNNGITVVCDLLDAVTDPDNPHIKIKNMQIVNGCQTATSIAYAYKQGSLKQDVKVIMRIYETNDKDIINKIVLSTNNQNKISNRDLRANDSIQIDIERSFLIYEYFYERKPRQYDNDATINIGNVVSNEHVAQSYLAIVLRKPSDARRRKYKVWGELYHEIFRDQPVEKYIIPYLIANVTKNYLEANNFRSHEDTVYRKIANNGIYHVARAAAYLWRGNDNWNNQAELSANIDCITSSTSSIYAYVKAAFEHICALVKTEPTYMEDIDRTLKSSALDELLDKKLRSAMWSRSKK